MKITTSNVENVKDLGMVNSVSVYGGGIITTFIYSLLSFLGVESKFMSKKMQNAIDSATAHIVEKASSCNADGIMNVQYQMTYLCVMAYGTAFKYEADTSTDDELPEL